MSFFSKRSSDSTRTVSQSQRGDLLEDEFEEAPGGADPNYSFSRPAEGGDDSDDGDEDEADVPEPAAAPEVAPEVASEAPAPQEASTAVVRKYADEDASTPGWRQHKKHMFILTSSGKPVYTRYGDEQKLSGFMCVLQAVVSFVSDNGDTVRYLTAGKHRFVFLIRGPLYLVAVSRTGEAVSELMRQLDAMHLQILSILTAGVNKTLERNNTYDVRILLDGTEKYLDSIVKTMNRNFATLVGGVHCLPLSSNIRNLVNGVLQAASKNLLYGILLADDQLVMHVRPRKHILHPLDLLLVTNFVHSSPSLRTSESWTPMCLPMFNNRGFCYAYISFVAQDICLLLITAKPDLFFSCREVKNQIVKDLHEAGAIAAIGLARNKTRYTVSDVNIPGPQHFLYKSHATSQFTAPELEPPYNTRRQHKRLFRLYQHVRTQVMDPSTPHKIYFHVGETETVLAWNTAGFELYATFGPLVSKRVAINACNRLLGWIKQREDSLFISGSGKSA